MIIPRLMTGECERSRRRAEFSKYGEISNHSDGVHCFCREKRPCKSGDREVLCLHWVQTFYSLIGLNAVL